MSTANYNPGKLGLISVTSLGMLAAVLWFVRPPASVGAAPDPAPSPAEDVRPAQQAASAGLRERARAARSLVSTVSASAMPAPAPESRAFADWSEEALLAEVRTIDAEIVDREWIERANGDLLSPAERLDLAALLARRDALSVERAERLLDALDREQVR